MQSLIPQTDPLRALVTAYDVWHALDPEHVADRDRVCRAATKVLDITHGSDVYSLRSADDEVRQYPLMLKQDVGKSLISKVCGLTPKEMVGGVTFGYIMGKSVVDLVRGDATLTARMCWKKVYGHILSGVDDPWVKDVLEFFDRGLDPDVVKSVDRFDIVKIVISDTVMRDMIAIDSALDAFDGFMDEIRVFRIEKGAAVHGTDPITGAACDLVSKMIYLPSTQTIFGKDVLSNNAPLTSDSSKVYTTNFFGSTEYTDNLGVSDVTDFKTAAMMDYVYRQDHCLRRGNEILFWALTGEDVFGIVDDGMTLVDVDNIGRYMFALSQGRDVPENATFGVDLEGRDIRVSVWRASGNKARIVWKGIRSYTWDELRSNNARWREDTFLWDTGNPDSPDAVAMRAGIDGYWAERKDGKPQYHWGLLDALSRDPGAVLRPKKDKRSSKDVDVRLRDDLLRCCVDGAVPSERVVLALSQAVQSYHSTWEGLVTNSSDYNFKVVQTMRARLAKCVQVRCSR